MQMRAWEMEVGGELERGGLEWEEPKGCQPLAKEHGMPVQVVLQSILGRRCQGEVVTSGTTLKG